MKCFTDYGNEALDNIKKGRESNYNDLLVITEEIFKGLDKISGSLDEVNNSLDKINDKLEITSKLLGEMSPLKRDLRSRIKR